MPLYQSVLVAVDLSEEAHQVVARARQLDSGQLHLVYVAEHPITGFGEQTGRNHRVSEIHIRQEIFPRLQALANDLPTDHLHIEFGDPADQVHELARRLGCDLVITGSHGKSGLKLLLGSTASSIVHGATCDVLTVRITEGKL